jgi:hypothetical protein
MEPSEVQQGTRNTTNDPHSTTQVTASMDQVMTKTMANYEEQFQKTIKNMAPGIVKKQRKNLDKDYQLKHSNLISDLDSMSESLKEQEMTKDFDDSWLEYKDTQLNGQVHTGPLDSSSFIPSSSHERPKRPDTRAQENRLLLISIRSQ